MENLQTQQYFVLEIDFDDDGELNEEELKRITEIATTRKWTPSEYYDETEDSLEYDIANQISDETGWLIAHLEISP